MHEEAIKMISPCYLIYGQYLMMTAQPYDVHDLEISTYDKDICPRPPPFQTIHVPRLTHHVDDLARCPRERINRPTLSAACSKRRLDSAHRSAAAFNKVFRH
jgi:hypothetical protein